MLESRIHVALQQVAMLFLDAGLNRECAAI